MSDYKYKAFISYRHLEPDMQAAEKLQKLLESYKPPKNIAEKHEKWRVFRDVSELQSSSDLSEDIKNAIENSEYLIVICSPEYNQSKWCLQELTRFRELHGNTNENIITLLVKGPPKEAFPELLTYTETKSVNDNGEEITVRTEVEPLAANITGDTLKESLKKLDTEYLRIVAPLLNCDFNDLYQREKRREAARRRRIFGAVSGVLSLITIISTVSALTINNKNKQIQKQNDQIKTQNEQIEKKNNDLLVENAEHLAAESEKLYKDSSLIPAIERAIEALPSANDEKPVIPEAEYALSREMGMYKMSRIVPQLSLRHETAIDKLSFMGEGRSIVSQDSTGIYFWDAESGKLLKKVTAKDEEFASPKNGSANKLDSFFELSSDKTGTYFSNTGAPGNLSYQVSAIFGTVYTYFGHDVSDDEPGTGGDVIVYNSDYKVWKLDGANGEIKWCADLNENAYDYYNINITDGNIIRFYKEKQVIGSSDLVMPGKDTFMEIIDSETGKVTDYVNISSLSTGVMSLFMNVELKALKGDTAYFFNSENNELTAYAIKDHKLELKNKFEIPELVKGSIRTAELEFIDNTPVILTNDILALNNNLNIKRMDKDFKEEVWSKDIPVNYTNGSKVFRFPKEETDAEFDVFAVVTKRDVTLMNFENGDVIRTISLDSDVVDVTFGRRGLIMFTVESGKEYVISINSFIGKDSISAAYNVQNFNTAVALCSYSRGKYVTSEKYSNTAYIQYEEENQFFRCIDAGEKLHNYEIRGVSSDGKYAAVTATEYPDTENYKDSDLVKRFYIYSTDNDKCTEVSDLAGYSVSDAEFIDSSKLVAAVYKIGDGYSNEKKLVIVDVSSGKVDDFEKQCDFETSTIKLIQSGDSVYYYVNAGSDIVRAGSDGSISLWSGNEEIDFNSEKKVCGGIFALDGSRSAVYYSEKSDTEELRGIEVYDFADGKRKKLSLDIGTDSGLDVKKLFWQNDNTVGAFLNDRSVVLFDAESGEKKAAVSLDGTSQEPVSVIAIDGERFAVFCRDSKLYEMNSKGSTGRSLSLEFDADNEDSAYMSEKASLLNCKPSYEASCVYVIWSDEQAWLINTDKFKVRYSIDDYTASSTESNSVFIKDFEHDKVGSMPLYTPDQLIDTAKSYLERLMVNGEKQ